MSGRKTKRNLNELVDELDAITSLSKDRFAHLSSAQLNWKPGLDRWSIGQCFDHLMTANEPYFPIFERIAKGEKKNSLWESMPFVPGLFGGLLVKSLDPSSTRKLKAPKPFMPLASDLDDRIIERFAAQQEDLSEAMAALEGRDLDAIKVTSPALKLITYSLRDACTIIVVHEQRHLQQAERVLRSAQFPAS